MPVTARLSQAFYERFGDDIANQLVEWFNAVDLTYRTELRELNDLNFARFDAKVGERLAELRAELRAETDARFGRMEVLLAERVAEVRAEISGLQVDLERRTQSLRGELVALKRTQKWMLAFWVPTALAIIGLFLKS